MTLPPHAKKLAFALYALLLFIGTHWPALTIPMKGRPDLVVHAGIFFGWTSLLILAGFFGPALSLRNIGIAAAISPMYAAIDEGLQAIPFVRRHAALDDWGANCLGIAIAVVVAFLIRWRFHSSQRQESPQAHDF